MYMEVANIWDLVFGCRRAMAMCCWRVVGTWMDSIHVYVFLSIARSVPAEVRFAFLSYREGLYTSL